MNNFMKVIEKIINKLDRYFAILTTLTNKFRFRKFGNNSIIRLGCILNNPNLITIEDNVFIGDHVWLNAQDDLKNEATKLIIKKGSHISRFCHINAFKKVTIEEDVLIAENVYLGDTDHKTSIKYVPIIKQGYEIKDEIIIKKGSFICRNVIINAGTIVGENSIIAPNVLVLQKNIPANSFVAGNPSRIFKRNLK